MLFRRVADFRARLEILARTYHRDANGQFAGGGDGGARGIRPELQRADTAEQIAAVTGHEIERITGHQMPSEVDMTGLDPDLARAHAEGILRTAELMPQTRLGEIRTYGPGAPDGPDMPPDLLAKAEYRGGGYGGIYLNTRWSAAERRDLMEQDDREGHAAGEPGDMTRVGSHEMGHVAQYGAGDAAVAKVGQQLDRQAQAAGAESTQSYVAEHISAYASSSTSEAIGEAVADVASRGDRATATSMAVVATLKEGFGPGPANRLNRTYKRDSKGRFGSGSGLGAHGPVRAELRKAKTTSELNEALAGGIERITGRRIPVEMAGSDLRVGREHAEGVLRSLERFPDAPLSEVRVVGPPTAGQEWNPQQGQDTWDYLTLGGAMAGTTEHLDGPRHGQRILISREYAGDPAMYDTALRNSGKAGFLVAASPIGIATHEMGHVVARAGRSATAGKRALTAEAKARGVKPSALTRAEVSHYAASSIHELSGESFADVLVHGADASPASKLVYAQVAARAPGRGEVTALSSRFFDLLAATRNRSYTRDSDGKFASGGGGSPDAMHEEAQIRAAYTFTDPATGYRTAVEGVFRPGDPNPDINERLGRHPTVPAGRTMVTVGVFDSAGNRIGEACRTMHPASQARVNHNYLVLDEGQRGQGFATRFNAHAEETYRANGIKMITLHANIDVGGYAWARAGYDFRNSQTRRSTGADAYVASAKRSDPQPVTDQFRKLAYDDKATPLDIAMIGHTPGATTWPGKEIMLESDWQGVKML